MDGIQKEKLEERKKIKRKRGNVLTEIKRNCQYYGS
jgi:hypothetical protein